MSALSLARSRQRRRARKNPRAILVCGILGLGLIGLSAIAHVRNPAPLLVWNASASAPVGLYRVTSGAPDRGDLALVQPAMSIAGLAAGRGYLPFGVPLIKRIAAVAGDDACAFDDTIIINGRVAARRLAADSAGRPMPRWNACRVLDADEVFLLTAAPDSFDSRYFGPVTRARIVGRLAPLWVRGDGPRERRERKERKERKEPEGFNAVGDERREPCGGRQE
ncbi:S26 family signal peptidase [Nitratireductor sp. XY-223]|uniref:S26 family signal peptidase n=1 Tax=Nitratireductor sp. XY-223 TaxID=2561926 RepID=UPI0010AA7ED4|nr:S26 family signal peptidase [Nitratireductor sp. XY-223]